MAQIRFFTDEDVYGGLAAQLRAAGFDAISSVETGRLGESDESQLRWATASGRVLVTFNVGDFSRLHRNWIMQASHIAEQLFLRNDRSAVF